MLNPTRCVSSFSGFSTLIAVLFTLWPLHAAHAESKSLRYSGRLTDPTGKPLAGPVKLQISLFDRLTDGPALVTFDFENVPLRMGIFDLELIANNPTDAQKFQSALALPAVFIEVADVTADRKSYPRSKLAAVPFALRIPVDGQTATYNANGELVATNRASANLTAKGGLTGVNNPNPVVAVDVTGEVRATQGFVGPRTAEGFGTKSTAGVSGRVDWRDIPGLTKTFVLRTGANVHVRAQGGLRAPFPDGTNNAASSCVVGYRMVVDGVPLGETDYGQGVAMAHVTFVPHARWGIADSFRLSANQHTISIQARQDASDAYTCVSCAEHNMQARVYTQCDLSIEAFYTDGN